MNRVFLTAEEAADALHISRSKVYDLIRNGDLLSIKIGRLRRVPVDAVQDFARRLIEAGEEDAA
ncbi:helix-turn-helix domain-containing protein [Pseudonocardia sp. ICBG1122]|nr:helix-turn-helix domain-containing protein [Pseudonocardia pini]